ncbi:ATP-binding protein [Coraliomargarita algicola]|uniref:histidine kinase n=1 Tax=Coraliomargarita algicola TaxID=3092156 RepID=A0ABZ0RE97_9BACT|nr:ATP-binding protein [Coraliomargarita sp. J2-16]WPJ94485.1 ATP-binding protein [Coraliomargarita sp. J2-16]
MLSLVLVLLAHIPCAQAYNRETGDHLFSVYTTDDHKAGEISSSIIEDAQGHLFVGNENGLLKFDGVNWSLMPETGHSSYVMSTVIDSANNIWVAALKSVGYYTVTPAGEYQFNDMTSQLTSAFKGKDLGTFWKLYARDDSIYLITSEYVLKWNQDEKRSWKFEDERRILPSWIKDGLYIHARGSGLFHLAGEDFEQIAEDTEAVASGIIAVLGHTKNGLLCATVGNGFFYLKDGKYQRAFPTHPTLADYQILHAFTCPNNSIILSTSHNGVIVINARGETTRQIPSKKPIYYSMTDRYGTIWSAGIGSIFKLPRLPLSYFSDSAYEISRYNGQLYYTNGNSLKKLLNTPSQTSSPQVIDRGTSIWTIQNVGSDLIYGDINGFNSIRHSETPQRIQTPRQIGSIYPSYTDSNILYTADPPKVSRWQKDETGWHYIDSLKEFNSGALSLAQLPNSKLLISSENAPVLLTDWEQVNPIHPLGEEVGLPEKFTWSHILQQGEHIIIISNQGLYTYDNNTEMFDYNPILGDDLGNDAYGLAYSAVPEQTGWIIYLPNGSDSNNPVGKLIWHEGQYSWSPYHLPSLDLAGKVRALFQEIDQNSNEILWVGGSKKILRYNLSQMPSYVTPTTHITRISELDTQQLYYDGAGPAPLNVDLGFPQKSLLIEYAATPTPLRVIQYQTRLEGFNESWSEPHTYTHRKFTNLSSGSYTFEVRAIDEFGRKGTIATLKLNIASPWYQTPYAYVSYIAFGLSILFGLNYLKNKSLRIRNERLTAIIQQRTRELEAQKLKLQQANKAKQNFLASMSHEIRNPLNGIIGISQLLRLQEKEQGMESEEITHLYSCSQHLNQLLSQTLDYSSLEAGKLRTRVESFAPCELLQEVIQIQSAMAQEKGIVLELEKPEIKHNWKGDPVLLRQILINLVSNGIKYAKQGSVRLILSYETKEESVQACFEVIDSGPGVPKEHENLIFEEFTRLPESEMSHIPGTGLGLTISAEMARLMGGSLKLDTEYQGGARFVLNLEFELELFRRKIKSNQESKLSEILKGKRVLIADDMGFNRYISAAVLNSMGAEIDVAENGRNALIKLNSFSYEIVILDINMPQMSGIEVVEAYFKKHQGENNPKFIALSAYNSVDIEEKCIAAGFNHFIEKPLDPEKLKKLLKCHHRKSRNNTGSDLLAYLSKNGPMSLQELQAEYNQSFKEELDKLRTAYALNKKTEQEEIIHKLLGLCRVQACERISQLVEKISEQSKQAAPKEDLIALIKRLEQELERTPHSSK